MPCIPNVNINLQKQNVHKKTFYSQVSNQEVHIQVQQKQHEENYIIWQYAKEETQPDLTQLLLMLLATILIGT